MANPDRKVGFNDLKKAKSAKYSYYIDQSRNKDINEEAYLGFEDNLHKAVKEWLANTKTANFFVYTEQGYKESMSDAIAKDNVSILIAAIVMSLYLIIFLGSFSPLHCRLVVALSGILSVVLSFFSGFGLLYYCGH